jgi:hypothetical protein
MMMTFDAALEPVWRLGFCMAAYLLMITESNELGGTICGYQAGMMMMRMRWCGYGHG